jgi:hypothetical protein
MGARGGGSFDSGDPHTTNLFIGNLAPDVDEQVRAAPRCSLQPAWPAGLAGVCGGGG